MYRLQRFCLCKNLFLIVLASILFSLPIQAQEDYSTIEKQLNAGDQLDTRVLKDLPQPNTAWEFSIRARLQSDWADARDDWRKAVNRSKSDPDWTNNFLGWLKLSLLKEGKTDDIRWMRKTLSKRAQSKSIPDEIWYYSGQVEQLHGHNNRALELFEKISEQSDRFLQTLLLRVKYELNQNNTEKARELLDRVFQQPRKQERPRYWLLKGQYFEKINSDSEAYIAYSHLINYYPDSYNRSEAELRIADLSLPRALYPNSAQKRASPNPNKQKDRVEGPNPEQKGGEFQVQAGSFRERSRARTVRQNLQASLRYPVKITEAIVNGTMFYRVRVYNIPSRKRASGVIHDIRSLGYDGYVAKP